MLLKKAAGAAAFAGLLLLAGCSDDAVSPEVAAVEGCNPLASEHDCLLPFPSDFFLQNGAVEVGDASLTEDGQRLDQFGLHPADGFSASSQIGALFREPIDDSNLTAVYGDLLTSLEPTSPTLVIDAETGELVMHAAELDARALDNFERVLTIRPMVRLKDARRYVVAIRDLPRTDGGMVSAPEAFAAIRDRGNMSETLSSEAQRFESDVFPVLEAAGVVRGELQLAWDFTTRSETDATADMQSIVAQTIAHFDAAPPVLSVIEVVPAPDGATFARVEMTMTVPLYLEANEPLALIKRDGSGEPTSDSSVQVPFVVIIPNSVANAAPADLPAHVVQFGHGFFGGREEAHGLAAEQADSLGHVVVAADWWGMADADRVAAVGAIINSPHEAIRFSDRVHQAMANFIALSYAVKGPLPAIAELQGNNGPMLSGEELYFHGISQGAILGATHAALNPLIDRSVLNVGGGNFSMMMFRSNPFLAFLVVVSLVSSDWVDQQKFTVLSQTTFDRIDPLTYAPLFVAAGADKRALLQVGIGDTSVPNVCSHLTARALGMQHLTPAPRNIAGLPASDGPINGSALVEFDFGVPQPDLLPIPPSPTNPAHNDVRGLAVVQQQLDQFFETGMVLNTCDGVCDPQ